jgi:dihydrofolate reductase
MRNLVYAINLSLDGVCDHTKLMADEEIHDFHTGLLRKSDTLLYGRVTYQLMVPFWPDFLKNHAEAPRSMVDFAQEFVAVKNIAVISHTLDKADADNTRILQGNLRDEIMKLKQEKGGNILVGGVDIPAQLTKLGLVDEFYFVIQPMIVGEGKRVLESLSLDEKLKLKLVESKIFTSGCVAHHYVKG